MNVVLMELVIQEGIKHRACSLTLSLGPSTFLPAAEQSVACIGGD